MKRLSASILNRVSPVYARSVMDTLSATYHEGRYAHFTQSEDSNHLQRCAEDNQADCSLRALTWDRAFDAFAGVLP